MLGRLPIQVSWVRAPDLVRFYRASPFSESLMLPSDWRSEMLCEELVFLNQGQPRGKGAVPL